LVVDDGLEVRAFAARALTRSGSRVESVTGAAAGLARVKDGHELDVIVLHAVALDPLGLGFLKELRGLELDLPLIVVARVEGHEMPRTGLERGVYQSLGRPLDADALQDAVAYAGALHHLALLKRRALELTEPPGMIVSDGAGLDARFERALDKLWVAFQPIVRWADRGIFGYEALVRSDEPALGTPMRLLDAAERLGRVADVGRAVRRAVAERAPQVPAEAMLFVNLHPTDLADPALYDQSEPLSGSAGAVVLELSERALLPELGAVRERVERLRGLGYRIGVDDLGAGYGGISSLGQLEPDAVKLDALLVRGIDSSSRKGSIVRAMLDVCQRELGAYVICEGVETEAERDTLTSLGAELFQGYLFAKPAPLFRGVSMFAPA
jgi:EAL domain-containing protein (putative c-di-GMP-specific phosphodiesterase class I)/CheY-like chemotaxis protein